jgi:arylformamidase
MVPCPARNIGNNARVKIIDISVPTDAHTTVFPGDAPPSIFWPGWTHAKGDPANVGRFQGGLHHGTHVDAPWHFIRGGIKMQEVPLEKWIGPADVVDLTAESKCVSADALERANVPRDAQRLLFKTRNGLTDYWREPWNPDFIFIHTSAAQWCVDRGIQMIALDYLTIDPPTEPTFPSHLILLGAGVTILENVLLRDVPVGRYTLHAAPVNLQDVDGAWCRAYLLPA